MKLKENSFYTLFVRPVVVITTISKDGKINAAPFSFNSPISFSPPLYGFSCNPKHDTLKNVQETGEFVVNVCGKEMGKYMHILEKDFPYGVNELEEAGLSQSPSLNVKPPRMEDGIAWLECKVVNMTELGDHIWITGEVVEVEVKDEYYTKNKVVNAKEELCHISGKFFAHDTQIREYKRA